MSSANIGLIEDDLSLVMMVFGLTVVLNLLLRLGMQRLRLPTMVGYILVGFLLRLTDTGFHWMGESTGEMFHFLGDLGVVFLLFRVGLDANLHGMLAQLRRASGIWVGNVALSGLAGYAATRLLGFDVIPSLVAGTAMTATSIAVSVALWQDAGSLGTARGELLLDIAELDDLSGVILLALLLAVLPPIHEGAGAAVLPIVAQHGLVLVVKLIFFGGVCLFLSKIAEKRIAAFFSRSPDDPAGSLVLAVMGVAIIVAALAGLLGFSVAIGAFFAGIVFNQDPKVKGLKRLFQPFHDLFAPFFFVGIGLHLTTDMLDESLVLGSVLFLVAAGGKILGTAIPARLSMSWPHALALGVSMVPRAEIAMVIMQQGLCLGPWAVTPRLFSAMVLASVATCLFTAIILRPLLSRAGKGKQRPAA